MKGRLIVLDHIGARQAAALMVDGRLEDLIIDPTPSDGFRPGAIFRAIADRPLKGQGGMMLKIPGGSAFFRQAKGLRPGQTLLVQVTGHAEPGKATPVSGKILFKSRYAIVTPDAPGLNISRSIRDEDLRDRLLEIAHEAMEGTDMGLILRSAAGDPDVDGDAIAEDIDAMRALAQTVLATTDDTWPAVLFEGDGPHTLAWRDWTEKAELRLEPGSFETEGVLDAIEDLRTARTPLASGAFMFVEPTHALVAVDVNTGADTSPAAALKANLGAARDLPRQLRLRGLGGQITMDFAPLAKNDRRQVEQALRAAFRSDPVETSLVGWTPLGHFELQRKRERLPLDASLK